jgi:hypothetical protein
MSGQSQSEEEIVKRLQGLAIPDKADSYFRAIVQRASEALRDKTATRHFELGPQALTEAAGLSDEALPRFLYYRYRYDVFPQTKEVDDYPPCVQIEPTSICNYRCVFCYQKERELTNPANGHMGMMDPGLFSEIIDELAGKVDAVTLASRGEPLMHKQFCRMITATSGRFLSLKINTNASFLDEEKSHAILSSGVRTLVVSADAAEEPLYSQLRVNGNLETVRRNVEAFMRIREKHYPESATTVRVSGVRYSECQDPQAMRDGWEGLVDEVGYVDYLPWENVYDRPPSEVSEPCTDLYRRMFVWWDGRLNPCDVDYLSTLSSGRFQDDGIRGTWNGKQYTDLRKAHIGGGRKGIQPCAQCDFS